MNPSDNEENRSVALYSDFENLHAGLLEAKYGEGAYTRPDNRFKPQEPLIDVQALVELGASFGLVAINRAYGNWQYFGRYRDSLLQSAVELIQLFPPGASAKNGADIKLCLDATEDISRFAHIGTVIIIGPVNEFRTRSTCSGVSARGSDARLQLGGEVMTPSSGCTGSPQLPRQRK